METWRGWWQGRAGISSAGPVVLLIGAIACAGNPPASSIPSAPAVAPPVTGPPVAIIAALPPLPAEPPPPPPAPAPLHQLREELDEIFSAPALARAVVAVGIQSVRTGENLFRRNAATFMMPASNMKVLTLAVAAERLGWDYRYETRLETSSPIEDGRLLGDMFVVGGGDPSIDGRDGDSLQVFERWAGELMAAGIHSISGRIVGDDNYFDDRGLGPGWSWDYLPLGYAAPVGALQYHVNAVDVTFRAGPRPGAPVVIEGRPPAMGPTLLNLLVTGESGSEVSIDFRRPLGGRTLEVRGSIPAGMPEFARSASVENPTQFFVSSLRATLIARGISVSGEALDIDDMPPPPPTLSADPLTRRVLLRHTSPPLNEIASVMMKTSQNVYADSLLKTIGARSGTGSVDGGRKVAREVLDTWAIAPDGYILADGSGLSRYNYVTAETMVEILRRMQEPRHAATFEATLPIGGVDGTLVNRFKNTRAQGNVRAKTGSIANVRALSGYVTTMDGEKLAFSILVNHFAVAASAVDAVVDLAIEKLANFTRTPVRSTATQ